MSGTAVPSLLATLAEADLLSGLGGRDRSDPRNPYLLTMFRLIGLADEAGTGIPKILDAWRGLGFHLPDIDIETGRYEFTLDLRYVHLLSEDDRIWLASFGDHWTEAEQLALVIARHRVMLITCGCAGSPASIRQMRHVRWEDCGTKDSCKCVGASAVRGTS